MIKAFSLNMVLYGGSNVLRSAIPLLLVPLLSKAFSPNEYGAYSLIETMILFVVPFITINANSAIGVEYFRLREQNFVRFLGTSFTLLVSSFVIFELIFLVYRFVVNDEGIISSLVWVVPLCAFVRGLLLVSLSVLHVRGDAVYYFKSTLYFSLIDLLVTLLAFYLMVLTIEVRLLSIYISMLLVCALLLFKLKNLYPSLKFGFSYVNELLKFGLPLIPHVISGTLIAMSDRFFISYYYGEEFVGYYTISYQVSSLMLLFGISLNQAWCPQMFRYLKDKNFEKVLSITKLFWLFLIFTSFVIFFARDFLFATFVDIKFLIAKEYYEFLLLGFLFQCLYFFIVNYLFYIKQSKTISCITVVSALLNIVLNFLLIRNFGVIGVAYATSITWFFVLLITIFIVIRRKVYIEYEVNSQN